MQETGWFKRSQLLLLSDVQAIGGDTVITSSQRAIASAHQAQVLDLLLKSVYTEKPQLSLENLRAPQAGTAAL